MSIASDLPVYTEHPAGCSTVTFSYDGDGNRVKKDEGGVATHYPGRHYESTVGSGATKYYYADGQLVTFERSAGYDPEPYGMRYVLRDHPFVRLRTWLGSTSVIVSGTGAKLWEDRYLPFGDVRYTYRKDNDPAFPVQTKYRYTSQWFEDGLGASAENGLARGLYFYGARWYDSSLGRFAQPDTIVPEPGNPQALNRYSYTLNNPVKFTDPTGHRNDPGGGAPYSCAEDLYCVYLEGHELAGWPVGTTQEDIDARYVSILVPEEGTVSFGVNLMGGAGLMGSSSLAFFHVDSEGNVVLISPSFGGGGIAGGAGEATLFLMTTNAENVEQLEGWFINAGAGTDLLGTIGVDKLWFKDYNTGEEFTGQSYNIGAGIAVAPLPGTEVHGGFGYTWLPPLRFNLYDELSVTRPSSN